MFVGSVGIRGTVNYIALGVIGNHDVLVAAACLDGESPGVVGVELGNWDVCDVELLCRGKFGGLAYWISAWFFSGQCVQLYEYIEVI